MRRNPNDSTLQSQIDELRTLLTANPLRSASVNEGRTRYYGGSELLIEDSNLNVTGTATIVGWLRVVGRIVLEGLGILTVNGLIELLGRMRVNGGGGINVEDGGDVVVDGGEIRAGDVVIRDGKVYVGGMVLDPDTEGGALTFPNGSRLEADGDNTGARLIAGSSVANVGDVTSLRKGSTSVIVSALGVTINTPSGQEILLQGAVRVPLASVPTYAGAGLPAGTLRLSTAGRLERADGS
ncbi:hypothetical protein [Microbacterium sp. Leaf179]|uniref:hypothetical protein n=1 Tax=Microbacterium sp. Leaf179 TaxID=1736288 RepID=UPI0006F63F65|nr:hypothetical protein [Microbacterium sp. Leaf179]KQR86742.1 hypothetical protein ASF96_10500 [Microbacterium sp. Leaf179]